MADILSKKKEARLMAIQFFHSKLQEEINEQELELLTGRLTNLTIQLTIFDGKKIA